MEFRSLCIFSCTLTLLIILIKPLTTKAHYRRASGDCGTSGNFAYYTNKAPHNKSSLQAVLLFTTSVNITKIFWHVLYSYHMCMRATVSLSVPRQELLHKGVSYSSFVTYRTRFSQVFSSIIQLRQKDSRQSCVTL